MCACVCFVCVLCVYLSNTCKAHNNFKLSKSYSISSLKKKSILSIVLCFDPAKNAIQGDAPEGSDTFQWPVIKRDRVGGLRLIIWDKVKVPLWQYRLIHRKRVTSELHNSYFLLMTIKHSISKIQRALNYYLTLLSSSPRGS